MKVKTKDVIWLAGLLEGEGCFMFTQSKKRGKPYPTIVVGMTDEDIIVRVSDIWDKTVCHRSNHWRTHVHGAVAISWMMTLYLLLGKRRRERIREIIKVWKETTYRIYGTRTMSKCHPDRVVVGFDMCQACYDSWRRAKKLLQKVG